jgi:hypothetical protein
LQSFQSSSVSWEKDLQSMGYKCAGMRRAYFARPYRCVLM